MRQWIDKETGINFVEPTHAEEWLCMLREIAIDYDGYRKSEDLMSLIDDLVEYAGKAIKCIHDGKIYKPEDSVF